MGLSPKLLPIFCLDLIVNTFVTIMVSFIVDNCGIGMRFIL